MFKVFRTSPTVPERIAHRTGTANGPIDVELQTTAAERVQTGVLVVGAFADGTMPPVSDRIDKASKRKLSSVIKQGDLEKKAGSTVLLHGLPGIAADRVLLVSLGLREEYGEKAFRDAVEGAAKRLAGGAATAAAVTLTDVDLPGRSLAWRLQQATWLLVDGAYRFDAPRTNGALASRGIREIALLVGKTTRDLEEAVQRGHAIAEGVALARDLGNLPGNVCNPPYLADAARALGREFGFHVEVLDREAMRALGMGAALAVGQASEQPCKFIVMQYKGSGARPVVLVGKGVTFDTGGISLKPGANMDEMKFDMCGAASVLGAMKTVARLKLPLHVVGLVPAVENMPGGNATRPGDVVRSMSGQTIEILNTDAEGRLALADALTYAERYDPACVIDIATLTGACVIALGNLTSGLFANDDELASDLLTSGTNAGDRAWRLPMFPEYHDQLKSNFADMSNLGGQPAGSITAACFLERFARHYKWAHLDIAGTSSRSGDAKGATGRPVPLLTDFLIGRTSRVARPH
ncbi:MAG TPA: leucyl aminopeptidase [Vicinamibacterales bacterium]|jgi:leucyl aminopeptidase